MRVFPDYNLSGQRISKPAKGVYIHRGHIINTQHPTPNT